MISELLLVAMVTATPGTLASIAMIIVGLRNGRQNKVIITKADEIHSLTNSNLTEVKLALAEAHQKIENLELILKERPR